jgi:hypothetical protein
MGYRSPFGLKLNEEPMEGNIVDDQPTLIAKLSPTHEYAQSLLIFAKENSSEFSIVDIMNMYSLRIY